MKQRIKKRNEKTEDHSINQTPDNCYNKGSLAQSFHMNASGTTNANTHNKEDSAEQNDEENERNDEVQKSEKSRENHTPNKGKFAGRGGHK